MPFNQQYSEKEIQEALAKIETFDHYTMCNMWRFHPTGSSIYFTDATVSKAFSDRLFGHFHGFTPEISKELGWKQ